MNIKPYEKPRTRSCVNTNKVINSNPHNDQTTNHGASDLISSHDEQTGDVIKFPAVLELNVGGVFYTTSHFTLVKAKESNMLSAMFSGQYKVTQDKDGKYFIDADGTLFSHILTYLRSGELPNPSIAPQVHREAKYFGLEELSQHIERMPVMMGKYARLQFQSQLPGFDDAVDQILTTASAKQCIASDEVVSYAIVAIARDILHEHFVVVGGFDKNHTCVPYGLAPEGNAADVVIGPWDPKLKDITERVYMRAVTRELEARGFTITFAKLKSCFYGVLVDEIEHTFKFDCNRSIFKLIFHWHKFV